MHVNSDGSSFFVSVYVWIRIEVIVSHIYHDMIVNKKMCDANKVFIQRMAQVHIFAPVALI